MLQLNQLAYELAQERRERELEEALRRSRLRAQQPETNPVLRAVGRSMISIGARLAGEPQPRLARSR